MKYTILVIAIVALILTISATNALGEGATYYDRYGNVTGTATDNGYGGHDYADRYGRNTGSSVPNGYGGYDYTDPYGTFTGSTDGDDQHHDDGGWRR